MANELDEMTGPVNPEGRDVNVIEKQIPVKIGVGSVIFEFFLWFPFILPGLIFLFAKISARYLRPAAENQHNASQIDNYRTRVQVLQNVVGIVEKTVELDKDVMKTVAGCRSRAGPNERTGTSWPARSTLQWGASGGFEAYPDLKAHRACRRPATEQHLQGKLPRQRGLQRYRAQMESGYLRLADKNDCCRTGRIYDKDPLHSQPRGKGTGKVEILLICGALPHAPLLLRGRCPKTPA